MLKKFLFLLIYIFSFQAFLYSADFNNAYVVTDHAFAKAVKKSSLSDDRTEAISYISNLRIKAGLWSLTENSLLDTSAVNHALYLTTNNLVGHYENSSQYPNGFTGVTPSDRAHYVNYNGSVSENLSAGQNSVTDSVDNLFSAIYHRLGFLSFTIDEIGMGDDFSDTYYYKSVFVYNMGNSLIRTLCEENSFSGVGAYVYGICIDYNKKIDKNLYDNAMETLSNKTPKYVLWPFNGDNNTVPVFFEESPDPLPNCSVSGYPVSVQFNETKINTSDFVFGNITLYDSEGNSVEGTLLTHDNDPNNHLSTYEFAFMPLSRLNWGEEYSAEATYYENGENHTINWSFITKLPAYPYITVEDSNATVTVQSGKYYTIYLKPSDCNDKFSSYNYSYNNLQSLSADFIDSNTIYVKLTGSIGGQAVFTFSNNKTVTITVGNSDNAVDSIKFKPQDSVAINVNQGWNLTSLPVDSGSPENVSIFYNDNISTVWKWSGNSWKIWSPIQQIKDLITQYGITQITTLEKGEGFWVNAKGSATINITSGNEYGIDILSPSTGWNLLGTGKNTELSEIESVFSNIKTVWEWSGNSWKIWSPIQQIKNFITQYGITQITTLKKGEGFWVNK